jgi:D-alanine-D-alanine ligase
VHSLNELQLALSEALKYDSSVLAEKVIDAAEYTVAILDGEPLPAIKLETDREFYDYEAKYILDDTRYLCPCGLSEEVEKQLQQLALQCFDALGCKGWGRVDFMADDEGNFFVIEANTVPGMTSHSLVPMAAKAQGYDFNELVLRILQAVR